MYNHYYKITRAEFEKIKNRGVVYAEGLKNKYTEVSRPHSLSILWVVYRVHLRNYEINVAVYHSPIDNKLYLCWYERGVKHVKKIQKKNDVC